MTRRNDAAQMSAAQRMGEIGSLLARGYRRSRISRQNGLADRTPGERPCEPVVYASESNESKEVA